MRYVFNVVLVCLSVLLYQIGYAGWMQLPGPVSGAVESGGPATTEWVYWNSNSDVTGSNYATKNDLLGSCMVSPNTGEISKISWRLHANNTTTGASVDVGFYDCDTGDTCTKIESFTRSSLSGDTWDDITLSTARAVNSGDTVCVAYSADPAGSTVTFAYVVTTTGIYDSAEYPCPSSFSKSGVSSDQSAARYEIVY